MKTYKKIDIYFHGDYICSTNQSRTCKEAVKRYLEIAENSKHSFAGTTLTQDMILKSPNGLKAYFDKTKEFPENSDELRDSIK